MSKLIYTCRMAMYSTDNTWHACGTMHRTVEPTFHGYARVSLVFIPILDRKLHRSATRCPTVPLIFIGRKSLDRNFLSPSWLVDLYFSLRHMLWCTGMCLELLWEVNGSNLFLSFSKLYFSALMFPKFINMPSFAFCIFSFFNMFNVECLGWLVNAQDVH